jgi:hypothetical protein
MDAPNVETREPEPCPMCGEAHPECSEAVLDGMSLYAWSVAEQRMSPEGMETLKMVSTAVDELGVGEFLDEARNVRDLPEGEYTTLLVYLARMTLIDAAREELYRADE